MIRLGITYREVLGKLPQEASEGLQKYLEDALGKRELESSLDEDTDMEMGGHFYLVQSDEDVVEMSEAVRAGDLFNSPKNQVQEFDVLEYIDKHEKYAILYQATNDAGGNAYILAPGAFEDVPSLHEHIFKASQL